MSNYDPNDQILVLRQHAQEILSALSWAHSYFSALDLADGYRNGRQTPQQSPATRRLATAFNHLEGYLETHVPPDQFVQSSSQPRPGEDGWPYG